MDKIDMIDMIDMKTITDQSRQAVEEILAGARLFLQ